MGKQTRVRLWSLPSMQPTRATLLTAGGFALGGLLGCLFSAFLQGEGSAALTAYLESYLSLAEAEGAAQPGWWAVVWQVLREALAVGLLRFTVLGVLLVPLVMGVKGFLLSFAISAFARCYCWRGLGAALLLFGGPECLQVTALFLLAVESWLGAERRGRELRTGEERSDLRVYVVCLLLLAGSAALQKLLAGPTVRGLALLLG
ncbi:MAG: hypothetical protein LUD84_10570 [Clostridiales bacterium]|nr:hypothetical protein [Clostridiales bacterium]